MYCYLEIGVRLVRTTITGLHHFKVKMETCMRALGWAAYFCTMSLWTAHERHSLPGSQTDTGQHYQVPVTLFKYIDSLWVLCKAVLHNARDNKTHVYCLMQASVPENHTVCSHPILCFRKLHGTATNYKFYMWRLTHPG